MRFAGEAARWLGIWLDASLNLEENCRRRIGKTRQAQAKLRRIVNQYGVPPASARNLQAAIVQGTMLYASELTWNGQDRVEGPYQLAINRMARATLGVQQSTPQGIIMAESGFTPARALLDHGQARFAQRLYARPQGVRGPEEILERVDPQGAFEGGGAGGEKRRVGREAGMGGGQEGRRENRGGEEGGGPQDSEGMEPAGHGVDGWVPTG